MPLLSPEALSHIENAVYLPMLVKILEADRLIIERGPFKLRRPYYAMIDGALAMIRTDLKASSLYMRRHDMKLVKGASDATYTEYVFINVGNDDHRRYLNASIRDRCEALIDGYLAKAINHST